MYRNIEKWINDEDHALNQEERKLREALELLQRELDAVELEHSHLKYLLESTQSEINVSDSTFNKDDKDNPRSTPNNANQSEKQNFNVDDSQQINLQTIDLDISEEDKASQLGENDEVESELDDIISMLPS